ncbi:uncharacterized protein LOC114730113 isoform X1 [Neltuma alba]|uniref:uncharacterized protein LOC114730113 isoform X1 n=1 Tax=Neltuma alba TaxID=207710 RepID=UPI0010A31330|nr:uncharacterized protein LOC114730113 isoform X1 [Prosopis alba]XP_028772970.1 uncharacterized protein LOC114730113 isoform X1 [Prosopis alba]
MNPRSLQTLVMGTGVILGGILTLNLASTVTLKTLHLVSEKKRKKVALPCMACRGKGFYICKLCKGNSTIEWSPLYDPIAINPCLCPTCEGNRVNGGMLSYKICLNIISDLMAKLTPCGHYLDSCSLITDL